MATEYIREKNTHQEADSSDLKEAPARRRRPPRSRIVPLTLAPSPLPTLADTAERESQPAKKQRLDLEREQRLAGRSPSPESDKEIEAESTPVVPVAERPVKKLPPQRMLVDEMNVNFHYDPTDMTNLPTRSEVNPYRRRTRAGPQPLMPAAGHALYTDAEYEYPPIPTYSLTGNMIDVQKDTILTNPDSYGLILLHYGGKGMFKNDPLIVARCEDAIGTFVFPGHDKPTFQIISPEAKDGGKANPGRPFTQPWCAIIRVEPGPLRDFLKYQAVFPLAANTSFSFYPVNLDEKSWKIVTLTGDAVRLTPQSRGEVLVAIKTTLWADMRFRKFVASRMLANGHTGSPSQLVKAVLDTYDIIFAEAEDNHGNAVATHVLVGEPFLDSKQECDEYTHYFTSNSFWVGISRLVVNAVRLHCNLCKSDVHNTYACSLPSTLGWLGPSNQDEIKAHEDNKKAALARERRREKETSSTELFGSATHSNRGKSNKPGVDAKGFQEVRRGKKRQH